MENHFRDEMLGQFLRLNPHAFAAWINGEGDKAKIHATYDADVHTAGIPTPSNFQGVPVNWEPGKRLTTLELPYTPPSAQSAFDRCQNEPVKLGTQIQPAGQGWVGTAGAPIHWQTHEGFHYYGFLTNWHVMPGGKLKAGHRAHQPLDTFPALGRLLDWSSVSPDQANKVDAAICDAYFEPYHTIAPEILETGNVDPTAIDAAPDMYAMKVGRTTGFTRGRVSQVGAAVRVSYGDFTALFVDQDIYESQGGDFSAPGDSGSLITCEASNCPLSLLFAGGGGLTVGNPIRHVVDALSVDFVFP